MTLQAKVEQIFELTCNEVQNQSQKVGNAVSGLFKKKEATPIKQLPKNLGEWLTSSIDSCEDDSLKKWVNNLSSKDAQSLTKAITEFSSLMQFNSAWLYDARMKDDPELAKVLAGSIFLFEKSYQQIFQSKHEIKVFEAYVELVREPNRHKDLVKKVYSELYDKKIIVPAASVFSMSERSRQKYMGEAIREAIEKDGNSVIQILHGMMSPSVAPQAVVAAPAPVAEPVKEAEAPVTPPIEAETIAPSPEPETASEPVVKPSRHTTKS